MTEPLPEGTPVWLSSVGGHGRVAVVLRDPGGKHLVVTLPNGKYRMVSRKRVRPMSTPGVRAPSRVTRTPDVEGGHLVAQPKTKTARSRAYLDFIRSRPCACCGAPAPSQAAHWGGPGASGGTGLKASDFFTLPACDVCHRYQHKRGRFPGPTIYCNDRDAEWAYRIQRNLLAEWVERREGGGE